MPSKNPRINLTISPLRYDLLTRLAKLQGTSRAALISETMEVVYPVLERVCVVLEAAQRAQETTRQGLRDSVAKAEAELMPMLYQAINQFDLFIEDTADSMGVELDHRDRAFTAIQKAMEEETKPARSVTTVAARAGDAAARSPELAPASVIRGSEFIPPLPKTPTKKPAKPLRKGVSADSSSRSKP